MEVVTIDLNGVVFRVYGEYTKAEADGFSYTGSPSKFEASEVEHKNDMIHLFLCSDTMKELTEKSRIYLDEN